MKIRFFLSAVALTLLAACGGQQNTSSAPSDGFIKELPEGVLAIVAPYQDLSAVRIDPEDGCFVYRYIGPVETTFLPCVLQMVGQSAPAQPRCPRQADRNGTNF